ncbi:MAG: helix-turn-helix domain-containing protein, partial [Alphaproteobacteria bacterium]
VVGADELPQAMRASVPPPQDDRGEAVLRGEQSLSDAVDDFERAIIREALARCDWNQTRTAERLGTTRRILKYRMDKLGIPDRPA